jgi:hypothetical protein
MSANGANDWYLMVQKVMQRFAPMALQAGACPLPNLRITEPGLPHLQITEPGLPNLQITFLELHILLTSGR